MPLKDLSQVHEVAGMVQNILTIFSTSVRTSLTLRSSLRKEMIPPIDVIPVRSRFSYLPSPYSLLTSQRCSQVEEGVILNTFGRRKKYNSKVIMLIMFWSLCCEFKVPSLGYAPGALIPLPPLKKWLIREAWAPLFPWALRICAYSSPLAPHPGCFSTFAPQPLTIRRDVHIIRHCGEKRKRKVTRISVQQLVWCFRYKSISHLFFCDLSKILAR